MSEGKLIWEDKEFNKNPFRVPDGYFNQLSDRIMSRVTGQSAGSVRKSHRIIRPWIVWISSAAAVLVLGWFGFQSLYLKPHQEIVFQERLALFADYFSEELHGGQLADYLYENQIDMTSSSTVDYNYLLQSEPEITEELIYESVSF
jgi:hypothetical protein